MPVLNVSSRVTWLELDDKALTFYQLGGSDHSVLDTIAQLTEGCSARDQPKQPPAKKELDDKALLKSYAVLQEGILCDVFLAKVLAGCSRTKAYGRHYAAWPSDGR